MTIYLIRHGKTLANERHLYCGSTDLPLSKEGVEELQRLSYHVSRVRFVTSGLRRTEETLQILFGEVSHCVIPELREVDFGSFEMRGYQELKDDPDYQSWISGDNESNVPPGGESGNQMRQRVLKAFSEISQTGQDTVIITHGGVIYAIMESLFPEEGKNRYQWQPENGRGYALCAGSYTLIPD